MNRRIPTTEVSMDVGSEQEIVTEVLYTVVVDSGMLLHQIEWSKDNTFASIINNYLGYK